MASSQSAHQAPTNKSKRILITTQSFPRYHATLSRRAGLQAPHSSSFWQAGSDKYSKMNNNNDHNDGVKFYDDLNRWQWQPRSSSGFPELPSDTQASLLSLGMRIRKNVNEGYKLPVARKSYSDSTIINPYANNSLFEGSKYDPSKLMYASAAKKRGRDDDDEKDDDGYDEGAMSEAETIADDDDDLHDSNYLNQVLDDADFEEADFLVPKDEVMML
ncbi:hypothetical protein V1514DRAFT_337942 [Lipomyces japonicus]|uniref:uncharacterized protein n=1 Tax=Lipomyces japonicus TaxID=56871 RepID=UPI0034CD3204